MTPLQREVMRLEIETLRVLWRNANRLIEFARDNPFHLAPHQRPVLWRRADRAVDKYLAEVERVLNQRIERRAIVITGPEHDSKRKPREAA